MEESNVAEAEESKDGKVKNQGDVDCFFGVRGIVHAEFLPQGQTINQHMYRDVLRRLLQSVRETGRQMYEKNNGCFTTTKLPRTVH